MFILEPAEKAKHSSKSLQDVHHDDFVTFESFYWSHSLADFSWVALQGQSPKYFVRQVQAFSRWFFFLGRKGVEIHARLTMLHLHRCQFTCDRIIGSICLLISRYRVVKADGMGPYAPFALTKRRGSSPCESLSNCVLCVWRQRTPGIWRISDEVIWPGSFKWR